MEKERFYTNESFKDKHLSGNFNDDLSFFDSLFKKDCTYRTRKVKIAGTNHLCALLFLDGMSSSNAVASDIIRSVFMAKAKKDFVPTPEYLSENIVYTGETKTTSSIADMLRAIMYGDTVIIIENQTSALILNTKGFRFRGVNEPPDERVETGPREGFDEVALLNVSAIRRKLQTPDFCCEVLRLGRRSDTLVMVCYLESLASRELVRLVKNRIKKIDIDGILDSNYIAESIRDRKFSPFKTIGSTERPDTVAARLLEGRVAIVVDGTPVVLTAPYLFSENFEVDEDYYQNFLVANIGRTVRILCFVLSAFAPGIFVALSCFHIGLLPTNFAISLLRLRTAVPVSSVGECLLLIFAFEILKEAGARAAKSTGQALSIVGGLVVGQAASEAGIISVPMLIVVALSCLCSVAVPRLKAAVFYLRLINLLACVCVGIVGFFTVSVLTLIYIFSIKSFTADYTDSLKKTDFQSLKDTVFRAPWYKMIKRPHFNINAKRQDTKK